MLVSDDLRVENTRVRRERIDGRIDTEFDDLTRKSRYGVKVRERRRRSRVRVIVGGHVNGLDRRNSTGFRRRNAFLHLAHFGRERRLVTNGGRHTSEQRRNLGAGLREAENVIDEEKHVVTEVAEVFGDRQARQSYAKT